MPTSGIIQAACKNIGGTRWAGVHVIDLLHEKNMTEAISTQTKYIDAYIQGPLR
jgi:hypothetical protein